MASTDVAPAVDAAASATPVKPTAPEAAKGSTEHAVLPRFQFVMVFVAMCLCCFLAGLDGTIVVTAMPVIAREFNALTEISWVIISFMLTQTALTPLWGRFCDLFGRRACTLFTVITFIIGSMACALSNTIEQLIVFRAFQGIGGGGIMACVLILLADLTPPSSRAAYMAPIGSMFALSSVCGPLLGGFLTDGPGWRFAFWINVPIGGVAMIVLALYVPRGLGQQHLAKFKNEAAAKARAEEDKAQALDSAAPAPAAITDAASAPAAEAPAADAEAGKAAADEEQPTKTQEHTKKHHEHKEEGSIDWAGIVTIVVAIICLCLALVWGGAEYEWDDKRIIALLVVASVLLVAFVLIEAFQASLPIMPMRLFKVRNFTVGAAISFFFGMSMTGGYVYLPIFFQLVGEKTAAQSGISMIPMMLGLPVGAIITGILITKYGSYRQYPVIGAIALLIACYLYTTMTPATSVANQVGYLILGGLAMGPLVQVPLLAAQNAVSLRDMPVASSTINFFQAVGGLLSTAIMQTILNNRMEEAFKPVIDHVMARLPPGTPMPANQADFDVKQVKAYWPDIYQEILDAYATGVGSVFWVGVGCSVVTLLVSLCMEHLKLKDGLAEAVHVEGAPVILPDQEEEEGSEEGAKAGKAASGDETPVTPFVIATVSGVTGNLTVTEKQHTAASSDSDSSAEGTPKPAPASDGSFVMANPLRATAAAAEATTA